jgi:hypothetical protein
MAAITDLSDLLNISTGGGAASPQLITRFHENRVAAAAAAAPVAGRWTSLFGYDTTLGRGVTPTTGAIPNNTSSGGMRQVNPGGSRQLWLTGCGAATAQAGVFMLYDRLFEIGGLSGTSISAQAVQGNPASPALTRYTDGVGVRAAVEIYTAIGATARTITMSYTNEAGTSGQTSLATGIGGTGLNEAQRWIPLALAAGDTGIRAIDTVTLSATTGTAGNFGIVIYKPIAFIPIAAAGVAALVDMLASGWGPVEIKSNACLHWAFLANTTSALTQSFQSINIVEK